MIKLKKQTNQLQQAKRGEKMSEDKNESVEKIWLEYEPYIRRLCKFKLRSIPHEADDCVSDVFLDFSAAVNNGKIIENPKAWLTKVASNKIKDIYSHRKRESERIISLEEEAGEKSDSKDILDEAFSISEERIIELKDEILSLLTEKERSLLFDRYSIKKSVTQIAKEQGVSENSISQRVFRLKVKIKMLIEKVLNETEN